MTTEGSKELFLDLALRMRNEWDRRVEHDYRYWMSDGVSDDSSMWQVGERDFAILSEGLEQDSLKEQNCLELGCGVGRLLRAAAKRFKKVIGVDVSAVAVAEADRLLKDLENVELILGNGYDLGAITSESVDFVYTFAALSSMPVKVIALYLKELGRIVKKDGLLRLQVYLGQEQQTAVEDTLAIRSFAKSRFLEALRRAGFDLQFIKELKLPFEISDYEAGTVAHIVGLIRNNQSPESATSIENALVENEEKSTGKNWSGSKTEYLMALARARQLLAVEDFDGAFTALEFAVQVYDHPEREVVELIAELKDRKTSNSKDRNVLGKSNNPAFLINSEIYEKNIRLLHTLFPETAKVVENAAIPTEISARKTKDGKVVLFWGSLALSHAEKPDRAAENWAMRSLNSKKISSKSSLVIFGFADAYYLSALGRCSDKDLYVFEPNPGVLKAALAVIDCSDVMNRAKYISFSLAELRNYVSQDAAEQRLELLVHPQTQVIAGELLTELRRAICGEAAFKSLSPSFAVMGPMFGGSLPIATYTANALSGLKQRVQYYNVDKFCSSYRQLADYVKKDSNLRLVQNQYTETLSEIVLAGLNERPFDILICLAQAPLSPRVLTELRKRGVITVMWFVEDCKRFLTWHELARYYDYMFLIQDGEVLRMVEQAGAGRAIYLPVACDPDIHRPLELSAEDKARFGSTVSFVGAGYNNRRHIFSTMGSLDFKIWGTEWPACLPFTKIVQEQGRRVDVDEYVKVFNSSAININLHSSAERDGIEPFGDFVNPRTFELASCGAFQLVDDRQLLFSLFEKGKEVAVFNTEKQLREMIQYFLENPEERSKIAVAARKRALEQHTYQHRLKTMLEYIYADRFEELKSRTSECPWQKTLVAADKFPELRERLEKVYERGAEPHLSGLVEDIKMGKGSLSETEQMLLFMHHVKSQISHISKLRQENTDEENSKK